MYINILRRLSNVVKKKRPEKWRNNSWFLLDEKSPAHRLVMIKEFLSKNNVTNLTCIQLICTRSLDRKQHWRESAVKMLLILWRMRRRSWKVFTKRLSRMFQTPLQWLAEVYGCIRGLFWRKCRLNNYNVLYFSEIKCFQELFETTAQKRHIVISLGDVVQWLGYGMYDRGATVIFFSKTIRTALKPTRSPMQWELGTLSPTKNRPNCEDFHVLQSSVGS